MLSEYRALVVEDEPAVRELTARALSARGFDCTLARDGREALEHLCDDKFDVVVTDFRMPNLNGHRLVHEIADQEDRPVVVVVTGVIDPGLVGSVLNSGADDILFKPVDYAVMAVKVRFLVEQQHARKLLQS